jgi:hypothetical protein
MVNAMTSKERYELKKHLKAAAAIIYKNTPKDQLQTFESLELALRDQLQAHVQPEFGDFFYQALQEQRQEEKDR